MSFLSREEVSRIGFSSFGNNVLISDKASFHGAERISIGDNVRIDDFCVLSAGRGGIEIGSYIHIGALVTIVGAGKVVLSDYSGLSIRVSVFSSNDDYSGEYMTNSMVPSEYTNVKHADVVIGKYVVIGCGVVILPGVIVGDGSSVGALSLVNKSLEPFGIYTGNPAKKLWVRKKNVVDLAKKMREQEGGV